MARSDCNTDDVYTRMQPDREETDSKHPAAETGAMRAALGIPYFAQVPLEAVAAGAAALEYGALKYENRNWEKGLPWQQLIDSTKRHIDDFERGRDYDDGSDGSGMHQVCMIMAGAMMLAASVIRGVGKDDRLPAVAGDALTAKECSRWMREQLDLADRFERDVDEV